MQAALPQRSVSPSHQFVIYGAEAALRGAVSNLAERTKNNLLALTRQRDGWKTPIVVNLRPSEANLPEIPAMELHFNQTGFGPKLQLDLTLTQNFDPSLMERELLRAILLEIAYRKEPDIAPGTALVQPPDWLLDGVSALTHGRDREQLLEALSTADKIMSLQEFLGQRADLLDSAGRQLYRAYSFMLVQLLINESDGPARLSRYIQRLSNASNDALADLKAHFPVLAGDTEKTWRLAVVRLGRTQSYQLLTIAQTGRRLEELLRLTVPGTGKSANLDEFARRKPSAVERAALNQLSQALGLFAGQANPVFRPVAREYQQIAALLAHGKRRGIAHRLAQLGITRQKLAARMSDIDDYMNWFEATQMQSGSGSFTEYLKAADQLLRSAPTRRDSLSAYLDSVADEFEN